MTFINISYNTLYPAEHLAPCFSQALINVLKVFKDSCSNHGPIINLKATYLNCNLNARILPTNRFNPRRLFFFNIGALFLFQYFLYLKYNFLPFNFSSFKEANLSIIVEYTLLHLCCFLNQK